MVLNVPAIVWKAVTLALSIVRSCTTLKDTIDELVPESNVVFKSLGFFLPSGLTNSRNTIGAISSCSALE